MFQDNDASYSNIPNILFFKEKPETTSVKTSVDILHVFVVLF